MSRSPEADGFRSPELDAAMAAYAAGQDSAFSPLFRGLAPRVRAFLRRLGCDDALADDLTQETFLRLHRARGSFAGGPVVPWVYAIARNCFIDAARAAKARPRGPSLDREDAAITPAAGPEANAEGQAIAAQTAALVEQELARMTPARREAFILLRYEGLSVAEAAAVVGATESAVKLRAFHAYEQLRRALGTSGKDDEGGGDAPSPERAGAASGRDTRRIR